MTVSDVMSRKIATVSPNASFKEVWRVIFKNKVNSLPVVDKKKHLVGILTREELLSKLYPDYKDLFSSDSGFPDFEDMEQMLDDLSVQTAGDLMRKRVIYTSEGTPVMRALSRMIVRRVNQLPVVDEHMKLVGMITKGDVFYSLFKKNLKKKS